MIFFRASAAFSLGLERSGGFKTVAFCEIEAFPRKVLAKHWPEVPIYDDVRTLTADRLAADGIGVDAICGGFPCQDISLAGAGAGLAGARSGLWSEYARLIGELRPKYVIVENVAELLGRGLGDVLGALAQMGFDAGWASIRASDIGADHERDRLWIVAHNNEARLARRLQAGANQAHVEDIIARLRSSIMAPRPFPRDNWAHQPVVGGRLHGISYSLDGGLNARAQTRPLEALRSVRRADVEKAVQFGAPGGYGAFQGQAVLRHGMPEACSIQARCDPQTNDDGESQETQEVGLRVVRGIEPATHPSRKPGQVEQRAVQPDDALRDLPQSSPRRAARIAALGNAVVPQIPELIGRAILAAEAK